jgi:hypothetical protein
LGQLKPTPPGLRCAKRRHPGCAPALANVASAATASGRSARFQGQGSQRHVGHGRRACVPYKTEETTFDPLDRPMVRGLQHYQLILESF